MESSLFPNIEPCHTHQLGQVHISEYTHDDSTLAVCRVSSLRSTKGT